MPSKAPAAPEDADETTESDLEAGGPLEELSTARHIIVETDFSEAAADLRGVFESRFEDPRATSRERFLWDYWHVENQYTLVRTQVRFSLRRGRAVGWAAGRLGG